MCVRKSFRNESKWDVPLRVRKHSPKKVKIVHEGGKIQYQEDTLAILTVYTKVVLSYLGRLWNSFPETPIYKILFHTTQPAHLVTVFAVILLSFLLYPNEERKSLASPFWTLMYLGSFSTHLGAQIWMTFVSGLSLYFALPRHTFGNVQRVLFPKYFLLNSILSLITLIVFIRGNNANLKSKEIAIQTAGLVICFVTELVIRLYLTPPLLRLINLKNRVEKDAGVGLEVGKFVVGNLAKDQTYLQIHRSFRKIHMTIAIGNIVAMACTMLHLYYLSQKLCAI